MSSDDNNFDLDGSYTYAAVGNTISVTALCETQPSQYRAFSATATFSATPSTFELYDATRAVRATYQRIE